VTAADRAQPGPSGSSASDALAILHAEEIRIAEQTLFAKGISSRALMADAGRAVCMAIQRRWQRSQFRRVVVLCGPGKNGGDGFIAARLLLAEGWEVRVATLKPITEYEGDAGWAARDWAEAAKSLGGETCLLDDKAVEGLVQPDHLMVDALYGIGLARPLTGAARAVAERMRDHGAVVAAVDIPSGVDADTGAIAGAAAPAALTVTFGWPKPGHFLLPGKTMTGTLVVSGFGQGRLGPVKLWRNAPALWQAALPELAMSTHKYQRGYMLIAGGADMPGAACLAALAARRTGAGIVAVAAPQTTHGLYLGQQPGLILKRAENSNDYTEILRDRRLSGLLIGSGLSPDSETRAKVLPALQRGLPLMVDGGGLGAFVGFRENLRASPGGLILTPHEGEFRCLFPDLMDLPSKIERARVAAVKTGAVVVLKGSDTVIAAPNGCAVIETDSPPSLATAGSGDVLAGIIGGLIAQGMPLFLAACSAVWLHGAAAQDAGAGLIAEDLPGLLPKIINNTRKII